MQESRDSSDHQLNSSTMSAEINSETTPSLLTDPYPGAGFVLVPDDDRSSSVGERTLTRIDGTIPSSGERETVAETVAETFCPARANINTVTRKFSPLQGKWRGGERPRGDARCANATGLRPEGAGRGLLARKRFFILSLFLHVTYTPRDPSERCAMRTPV